MLVMGKLLVKKIEQSSLQLHLNSTEPEQVDSYKLLGVTIDSQLTFDQERIAVLWKIRRLLPLDQRKLSYNGTVKQTMLYASTVWASCSVENIRKVFRLQKCAARVILGTDRKANNIQLFKQFGLVPFMMIKLTISLTHSVICFLCTRRIFLHR